MPLPEKVIEQLGREPPRTPGWSFGLILFSGGIFTIVLLLYFGLTLGYKPYLQSQVTQAEDQINQLSQSVSLTDQTSILNFYSQIANLKSLIGNHVGFSHFFAWLQKNTEANVYFQGMQFSTKNQVTLTGWGKTVPDINGQLAVFEASPDLDLAALGNVTVNQNGGWDFTMRLTTKSSITAFSSTGN